MYSVYVLTGLKDGDFYIGRTKNLNIRLAEHCAGRVPGARDRGSLVFAYAKMCNDIKDAVRRKKCLKKSWGKRYLRENKTR